MRARATRQAELEVVSSRSAEVRESVPVTAETAVAALKMQASFRGRSVRQELTNVRTELAVTKVQAIARGHLSRNEVEEARRLEWLSYYMSGGQFDDALELAMSRQEVDGILALQSSKSARAELSQTCFCFGPPRAPSEPHDQPAGEAPEPPSPRPKLAVPRLPPPTTPEPSPMSATMAESPSAAASPATPMAAALSPPALSGGGPEFVRAMREYDWARATALAATEADRQAVADSQVPPRTLGSDGTQSLPPPPHGNPLNAPMPLIPPNESESAPASPEGAWPLACD